MNKEERNVFIMEIIEKLNPLIESKIQAYHTKPSPDTIKLISDIQNCNKTQNEKINTIGKQVEQMYIVFTSASLVKRAIIGIIALTGSVMGLIIGWKEINK